jgi:hypothetical protein
MSQIYFPTSGSSGGAVSSVTGGTGITATPTTGAVVVSLTNGNAISTVKGNDGTSETPTSAGIFNIVTSNSTVTFTGSANTETLNFAPTNLILGSSGASVTSASSNVGVGPSVLLSLTSGTSNVALGTCLYLLTSANNNVAIGINSLIGLVTGNSNTAVGTSALQTLNGGTLNVALGFASLDALTTGNNNIGIGASVATGIKTGSSNIIIGQGAGSGYTSSESNNIIISNAGTAGESNVIRIGTQGIGGNQQSQCYLAGVLNTSSGQVVNTTTPGTYPYTTLNTDYAIFVTTTTARSVNLLASPVTGTTYRIKDITGSAATNHITVTPAAGTIDGASTYVISTNYGSVDLTYNGSSWSIL